MLRSVVQYCADHKGYKCGYCKSLNSNYSHGLWAQSLTVVDYQNLIDRGWRRSGKYLYKPTMDLVCCPMYTIRSRALDLKSSKSQKKVLKRINKFLSGQNLNEPNDNKSDKQLSRCSSVDMTEGDCGEYREQYVESNVKHEDIDLTEVLNAGMEEPDKSNIKHDSIFLDENLVKDECATQTDSTKINKGVGPDPTKQPCKKAKQLRRERKLAKLKEQGIDVVTFSNSNKNKEKQVEDFINELPEICKNKLEIKLVRTASESQEWLGTAKATHELYVKYQMAIHGDKPKDCRESQFLNFLVASPLLEEHTSDSPPCGYGSFHQQYWLEGKLVAVGVIDILPKCVSSVYFFYDPQYMNLTLGTYGALREIAFVRHLNSSSPQLKYYYMGFYIHSCRKMRYKANYHPSELLCPETYNWFPIKDCIPKLEVSPYSRLNPDLDSIDTDVPKDSDIDNIQIYVNGFRYVLFKNYKKSKQEFDEIVEYARLVGAKTARRMILYR